MKPEKYNIDIFELKDTGKLEVTGWIVTSAVYNLRVRYDQLASYMLQQKNMIREDVKVIYKEADLYSGFTTLLDIDIFKCKHIYLEYKDEDDGMKKEVEHEQRNECRQKKKEGMEKRKVELMYFFFFKQKTAYEIK